MNLKIWVVKKMTLGFFMLFWGFFIPLNMGFNSLIIHDLLTNGLFINCFYTKNNFKVALFLLYKYKTLS
jgi:hypothetical protein